MSATEICTSSPTMRPDSPMTPPRGREFEGVGEKVEHDLAHAPLVGQEQCRRPARQSTSKVRPTLGGPFAGMGGDIGQQRVEIDPFQLQPQRAGFDQRQIENVVDQVLQRVRARHDGLDIFVLARD